MFICPKCDSKEFTIDKVFNVTIDASGNEIDQGVATEVISEPICAECGTKAKWEA